MSLIVRHLRANRHPGGGQTAFLGSKCMNCGKAKFEVYSATYPRRIPCVTASVRDPAFNLDINELT